MLDVIYFCKVQKKKMSTKQKLTFWCGFREREQDFSGKRWIQNRISSLKSILIKMCPLSMENHYPEKSTHTSLEDPRSLGSLKRHRKCLFNKPAFVIILFLDLTALYCQEASLQVPHGGVVPGYPRSLPVFARNTRRPIIILRSFKLMRPISYPSSWCFCHAL